MRKFTELYTSTPILRSLYERTRRISPPIDLVRLSPVPVGATICPYTREFRASLRRKSLTCQTLWRMVQSAANPSPSTCQPVDTLNLCRGAPRRQQEYVVFVAEAG
jgi:hypothetical protein